MKGAAIAGFSFTALGQLVGCGSSGSSASTGTAHDKLVIVYNDAPDSLDPVNKWDGWYAVCRGLTETLVVFDDQMNLQPCLATEWSNVDKQTWKFKIREGVTFHSGKEMTPQAVKASLERTIAKSSRAADKVKIDSIAVDGQYIVLKTKKPIATVPGEIAEPVFSIVDVDVVDEKPQNAGTGPYDGTQIDSMENFTLSAYSEYWNGAPKVKQLNCQTITDANSRAMGLQSADANIAASLLANDLATLKKNSSYTVLTSESVRVVFMICNYENELLADKAVRQALSYATDRDTFGNTLLGGNIIPNGTPFPSYLSYSQAVKDQAQGYDLEKAKKLLSDAGYKDTHGDGYLEKDGKELSFRLAYYSSRPELPVLAPALQDAYKQIGIKVTPQLYENIDTAYRSGDFDLMLYNTTTIGNGDPSYYLGLYFASTGSENAGKYVNKELDTTIAAMQEDFDQQSRYDAAEQAEKLILEDCPDIFFGSAVMNAVEGPDVTGYDLYPVEYYGVTNKMA